MLFGIEGLQVPVRAKNSTHVFHQYTLLIENGKRDALKHHLEAAGIPVMIYYPVPLNEQEAFLNIGRVVGSLNTTLYLCKSVLSLPMHTELTEAQQVFITDTIKNFFKS